MTFSPGLDGGEALIRLLGDHGVVASLGHSRASKAQLHAAIDAGLSHVCHLYNAFDRTTLRDGWQWEPDLLVCVLINDALRCEIICDMIHVPPEYVMLAIRAMGPDRVIAITDSQPGAGLPPGQYTLLDGREFTTRNGVARLTSNGDIVGSVLTMNKAFANLVEHCGVGMVEAARYTSTNAAASLGISDRLGGIEVGKQADLAVLDADYQCIATFVDGKMIHGSGNQTREQNHRDTTDRTT
jgi:N-acetylglucosamine-6-phosphate deacetylase